MREEAEVARRAAARLRRNGWIRTRYGGIAGPNCLVGALDLEASRLAPWRLAPWRQCVIDVLHEVIIEQYPQTGMISYKGEAFLTHVNDSVLTSGDEAIALLEKAAVRLEEAL